MNFLAMIILFFFDIKNNDVNANIGGGIFSAYAVMVTQDPLKCWFRDNFCACVDCMTANYNDCKFKDEAGVWVEKSMKQIPVKSKEPSDIDNIIEFYKKGGRLANSQPTLIAVLDPYDDSQLFFFELRTFASKALKELIHDTIANPTSIQFDISKSFIFLAQ